MIIKENPEEQARLRACTDEIAAILRKYDFAGVFSVSGRDTSRHMFEVSPTWSCLKLHRMEDGGVAVRFKAAMKTGGEGEKQRGNDSIGMLMGLLDAADQNVQQLTKLIGVVAKAGHLTIDHASRQIRD